MEKMQLLLIRFKNSKKRFAAKNRKLCDRHGKLKQATIRSKNGDDCFVQLPAGLQVYDEHSKRTNIQDLGNVVLKFQTVENMKYSLQ